MTNQITFVQKGDFRKLDSFLERMLNVAHFGWLDKYGRRGVDELRKSTPRDSGLLADSWRYEVERTRDGVSLCWYNDDVEGGCNVAILIEFGHATKSGTHVAGKHFITPAIQEVFDQIAEDIDKEISRR